MADKKGKKGGGARKIGRAKIKCARYQASKTRERNKTVRVARSSGKHAALAYAEKFNLRTWAVERLRAFERKRKRDANPDA